MSYAEIVEAVKKNARRRQDGDLTLQQALEAKRIELGLSMRSFAAVLGMDPSNYGRLIAREQLEMPMRAAKRAYALGVHADLLLSGE